MFCDRYLLTKAVLNGRKTMTRRIIPQGVLDYAFSQYREDYYNATLTTLSDYECLVGWLLSEKHSQYKVGEIVGVAQSYKELGYTKEWVEQHVKPNPNAKLTDSFDKKYPGWNNKMFVPAEICKNRIKITDVKVERLQDISDEDVFREGFERVFVNNGWGNAAFHTEAALTYYDKLGLTLSLRSKCFKEAFSFLVEKLYGINVWGNNPYVEALSFELNVYCKH